MPSISFKRQPRSHRVDVFTQSVSACAIWSRFASPRAELVGSPSLSRPNLFAGD
ncbi:MAG TPA: hypothetical protein VM578_06120 [Candidatus Saccharimonadales bacterium]|nr:hypothetical protein [Candidatus Saccharimonadales bacterium]